jgi:hypothetical protein
MSGMNAVPVRDPIRNLVNSCQRSDVKTVIVNGEVVVENGRLLTIDQDKLVKEVQRLAEGIWSRIPKNHYLGWTADEISPQSLRLWEE